MQRKLVKYPIVGKIGSLAVTAAPIPGNVWGRTHDMSILGLGKSDMDPIFQEAPAA